MPSSGGTIQLSASPGAQHRCIKALPLWVTLPRLTQTHASSQQFGRRQVLAPSSLWEDAPCRYGNQALQPQEATPGAAGNGTLVDPAI